MPTGKARKLPNIRTWTHTVNEITEGDEQIALCPDNDTASRVAQALENQEPLKELVRLCRKARAQAGISEPWRKFFDDTLKPFEGQF